MSGKNLSMMLLSKKKSLFVDIRHTFSIMNRINTEDTELYDTEKASSEHARILVGRSYIKGLASLLYASTDHCSQVTEDDVQNFAEVIAILVDPRIATWRCNQNKTRGTCMLVSHLCSLLVPIFIYGTPAVNISFIKQMSFLRTIPRTIRYLLESKVVDESMVNACVQFYTLLVQSTCKQEQLAEINDDKESSDESEDKENIVIADLSVNPRDLISSFFDLQWNVQQILISNKESIQRKQVQSLLQVEWKNLDILQLQQKYEELERETKSLTETLSQTKEELQRTQSEKD